MSARRLYPTRYRRGPYAVVAVSLRRGFSVIDTRTRRYAVHAWHQNTGRMIPRTMTLPDALRALEQLATEA